ncbi:uncharacterized protein LOC111456110 isoform X4 [Cucurbita moschata]|uniref:Uncharacterized protein LOC111456110 isoform X4 n=1 Tax=Cucurbita moschata TaxID=3662 RepID=A0A6J1GNT5_CUCMO|nr:uncharacterized protein LOC111456110 isoform X4 [Cucurbita moschata]
MAENVVVAPCIKLQIGRTPFEAKSAAPCSFSFKREQRESSCGSYKFTRISTWRRRALSGFRGSNLIVSPAPRKIFREHAYLRSLVNVDGTTASEVNNLSTATIQNMDDLSIIFSKFIQKSSLPVCMSWLKNELSMKNNDSSKAFLSLMSEKLKAEDNILPGIKKSGKEELYAELMHFLSFGPRSRDYCYYDYSLFVKHGISILEDLLITFADGIASMYLEFISVDSSFFDEVDNIGLALCTLSTRALQRLRNEVAMNQWLYQNIEAIVSMYEDRFDLCTLSSQQIELPGSRQANIDNWWMKHILRRRETLSSELRYVVIDSFAMPVKRTKELRALRGWRYYFSLLIELSDITTPMIRVVIDKISSGISFFLVCLIGRSLGLIYTGIRQSLRWK